jgi:uncharacterized membrane protein YqiK
MSWFVLVGLFEAWPTSLVFIVVGFLVLAAAVLKFCWFTLRFIPNDRVGVVEKLWSAQGSVPEGQILALSGEAGYQADVLRGGIHWGYWRWQYRIHKAVLVTIPQGKIGYVYARDGQPLPAGQTLGSVVPCNHFQDARAFLDGDEKTGRRGQRGRQLAILREGVYAVNPALFVVITESAVYALHHVLSHQERLAIEKWHKDLADVDGYSPVVIGRPMQAIDPLHPEKRETVDSIGIVTIHDGPSLAPGEIIAPVVGAEPGLPHYHNNFQDPQAFLDGGGRRGRQYVPLTDGTYFINRWFATLELIPKTVVPIGYVGVVVSYYGRAGVDLSGAAFRHGERVAEGERGVWERPLGPGKYAFNTYAGSIVMVPTTNFVLHWITGKSETHRYDESLRSIDLVTRDAYEPRLPLSVVVHIDYQRAPNVIQRFGDVKKLITQTIDPLLSAFFRDIAHKKTMLELLHERDVIQNEARAELRRRFHEFDIECVDVLIGKPDPAEGDKKIESLLEQLRLRQLSIEQLETYERQKAAMEKLRLLNEVQAQADMQQHLTSSRVKAQIAESEGEADLARARKQAEKAVVMADAQLQQARRQAEQTLVLAEADSRQAELNGRGEGQRILQAGLAEAAVLQRKVSSYGDPRLYSLAQMAAQLAKSAQPLVPEQVFITGATGDSTSATGVIGTLLGLLLAEKSGFHMPGDAASSCELQKLADRFTEQALATLERTKAENGHAPVAR